MKSPPLSWQSGNYLEKSSSGIDVDGKEEASDAQDCSSVPIS